MKKLIISLAILMFLVSAAHAQTVYFTATDTVHNVAMSLDSVYVRCNTNGADTTLRGNPTQLEVGGLLGVDDKQSETALGIKLSAMNFSNGRLYVMVTSPKPDNVSFLLSDLTGRTLINSTQFCVPGANNFALDAPGIKAGMYFLTISNGFSTNYYKVLGTNSGSGEISITNIGFPIKTVLAGTSDFIIIGYATGKIVSVLSDTINNYTPIGNDTVKFDFGDEWSKWKFRKMSITIYSCKLHGTHEKKYESEYGGPDTTYPVESIFDYNFEIFNEPSNKYCGNQAISNMDTIKFCNYFPGSEHLYTYGTDIIMDSVLSSIHEIMISNYDKFSVSKHSENSDFIKITGNLTFTINKNGSLYASGWIPKDSLAFTRKTSVTTYVSISLNIIDTEYLTNQKDGDLNFTLTLEP